MLIKASNVKLKSAINKVYNVVDKYILEWYNISVRSAYVNMLEIKEKKRNKNQK